MMSTVLTFSATLAFMLKISPSFKRFGRATVALALVASSAAVIPASSAGAWNSTDVAIGSHPVASPSLLSAFGMSLDVDASGNTVTTFQIHSPNGTEATDIEPGNGSKNLVTSQGSFDGVITKFNSSGSFDWAYHIRGTTNSSEVIPSKIRTDSQGNIYLVGIYKGSVQFGTGPYDFDSATFTLHGTLLEYASNKYDGFILKLNPSGVLQWVQRMVVDSQNAYTLYLDVFEIGADDSLYIGGTNYGAIDVNYASGTPQNEISFIANSSGTNTYIAKFSNNGNYHGRTAISHLL